MDAFADEGMTNVTVHCLEERDARYRDLIVKFPGESVHPGGGLSSSVGRSWTIRPSLRTPSPPLARTAKYRSATMKTKTISAGINQKCNIIPYLSLLAQA